MKTTVHLGEDQTAEPNKCGSCQYFKHRQDRYDTFGICRLRLPPWVHKMYVNPKKDEEGWEVDPHTVRDTDTCSFYEPRKDAGETVVFVQERKWTAGEPSK